MRFQSYFNTAIKIIGIYNGSMPLSDFLKQYFSANKKHGSKDRKFITQACYNYYRIGFLLNNLSVDERLKVAIFLCNEHVSGWTILYDAIWLQHWSLLLNERFEFIQWKYKKIYFKNIFPFTDLLSKNITENDFIQSHLIQPDVFLRARPHQYKNIITEFQKHEISFEEKFQDCIAINNSTKLDAIIKLDTNAVIQDYSSQRIKEFLLIIQSIIKNKNPIKIWDCCAGSGGKSILAYDILNEIDLTVTDVRASIIYNLKERFKKANIKNYKSFVFDVTNENIEFENKKFDLIICDVPCTGSGTWSRTPEQLCFFKKEKIDNYTSLQKKIVSNATKQLKTNGLFLYITCSVFKKENEMIAEFISADLKLNLIKSELLEGYTTKADTMFAALFNSYEPKS